MRLLVILSNYPFPPQTGSSIVAFNTLKLLSLRHQITLICPRKLDGEDEFNVLFKKVEFVTEIKVTWLIKWITFLFRVLGGAPPTTSLTFSSSMVEKVRNEVNKSEFDVILLFEMNAIQYCPSSCFDKLAVNIEDPQSIKLHRVAKLSVLPFWRRAVYFVLGNLTSAYEKRTLHKIRTVFLLSSEDINDMHKQGGYKNLAHVPYGAEPVASTKIRPYSDRERVIIISGNMFHPPNVDGVLFFLVSIFPLILRGYPSALLWIVGANPDERIAAAAENFGNQVVITGRVDDLAGYIKRATVSVCPVRLKIGVQTKILEALSWGTPVVTTSAGNSGIGGVSGTHVWVEDDEHMMAQRVCELLCGKNWERMSTAGRKLVTEHFSWEKSTAQLEHHLETIGANS